MGDTYEQRMAQADGKVQWAHDPPEPLTPPRVRSPFPVDALPGWGAEYARQLARFTQTPEDMAGAAVLGVLAACCGGRVVVEASPGWREPTNLYLLPVMAPGTRKSAVIAAVTGPLYAVEKDLIEKKKPERLETETLRQIADKAAQQARTEAAKPDATEDKKAHAIALTDFAEKMVVPATPRLVADDVTAEAIGSLLADHDGRIAVISAEAGIFEVMAGRYSHGVPQLDVWLKGHAGDQLRVDRKTRDPEHVEAPALTILLTAQPMVLSGIASNGVFRGRGLLARFLYAIPTNNVGHRVHGQPPVQSHVTDEYSRRVSDLITALVDWTDPVVLTLTADAAASLLTLQENIEPRLAEGGDLGGIVEWGSKLVGAIVRIAGLLHMAAPGVDRHRLPITDDTLQAAIRIGEYFAGHALIAFDLLGQDRDVTDAHYILCHLRTRQVREPNEFTVRDLFSALPRSRFAKVDDLEAPLDILLAAGWIALIPTPSRTPGTPGRPPSPRYAVHPAVRT